MSKHGACLSLRKKSEFAWHETEVCTCDPDALTTDNHKGCDLEVWDMKKWDCAAATLVWLDAATASISETGSLGESADTRVWGIHSSTVVGLTMMFVHVQIPRTWICIWTSHGKRALRMWPRYAFGNGKIILDYLGGVDVTTSRRQEAQRRWYDNGRRGREGDGMVKAGDGGEGKIYRWHAAGLEDGERCLS